MRLVADLVIPTTETPVAGALGVGDFDQHVGMAAPRRRLRTVAVGLLVVLFLVLLN